MPVRSEIPISQDNWRNKKCNPQVTQVSHIPHVQPRPPNFFKSPFEKGGIEGGLSNTPHFLKGGV